MPGREPPQSAVQNRILSSLPPREFELVSALLKPVTLTAGQMLHAAEERPEYVYFLEEGLVSLRAVLDDGESVEVGLVGREGISDVTTLLTSDRTTHQALVQVYGHAFQMRTPDLLRAFEATEQLWSRLIAFAQLLLSQTVQIAACNAVHTLEARLARWLLTSYRRVHMDTLPLTHDHLSQMLGVRRSGVTVAAGFLQRGGLIRYTRKDILILDRAGLESVACECFKAMNSALDRFV